MQRRIVHSIYRQGLVLALWAVMAASALADSITLHPSGGSPVTGEMMSPDEKGVVLRLADGNYSDPIPWARLTQEDLKEVLQQNARAMQYVEPFIEVPKEEKIQRTSIDLKPVPRLDRPAGNSFLGALATSSMGVIVLLFVYGGNIYAAYEISIFRAQPVGLVCGVAAVAPIIGPIIFLSMPTRVRHAETGPTAADAALEAAIAEEQVAPAEGGHAPTTHHQTQRPPAAPPSSLPPAKNFLRGQFTFNRRFFETQVPGFFAVTRPEADKEMALVVKSARGTHIAQRISRITPNDIYIQVQKGHASEDVIIPFVEIQEVTLKHRDA